MDYILMIQKSIDYIDTNIKEYITIEDLSSFVGFSKHHFQRIFSEVIGIPVMQYIVKRKLQYALYDLSKGRRIIDVALDYGFETHAGFTKAFKKIYVCPPKHFRLHVNIGYPDSIDVAKIQQIKSGGLKMNSKIINMDPVTLAGYTFNTTMKNAKHTRDIPVFWSEIGIEGKGYESKLYHQLKPNKHGEYCVCINVNEETDDFQYFFAVESQDTSLVTSDMTVVTIPKGKYIIFTTPLVEKIDFINSIKGAWKYIFEEWLPNSEYVIDEDRYEFEFYDERCHPWVYDKICMDIYIPIK